MENEKFLSSVISVFKRYLPKRVIEKIMVNPSKIKVEGEKRFATILFGDLSGFTALTEKLEDPEKIVVIINRYFKRMLEIVEKYGGDVDKFLGDALMVIFGAPVAHSNDPERACRAALEMIQAIKELGIIHTPKGDVEINMSIGINTGDIVALNMGSDKRMEYTVMGDNVNLSSRLEGVAKGGEVIISDRTYKYVKDIFNMEVLEPVKVKGKEKPIPIYLLKSVKSHLRVEETPFFNRKDELKKIQKITDALKEGKGKIVLIRGEQGVGKTSLMLSSLKHISGIRKIHLKAYPYSKKMIYQPLIDWGKSEYGNTPPEILNEKKYKVKGGMIERWDKFIAEISEVSPILIYLEDAHNCDEETLELLYKIFTAHNSKLALILESHKDIKIKALDNTILLKNFDFENSVNFIKEIKYVEDVDIVLSRKIFSLTNGNPFFIKEIINFLEAKNIVYMKNNMLKAKKSFYSMEFPPTIRSLVMERIDEIPEGIKTLLQFASVFGKPFSEREIIEISEINKENVKEYIKDATSANYIIPVRDKFEIASETIKGVLYDSLFKQRRKKLHLSIAKYLEEEYKDNLQEIYDTLAYHYEQAGIKTKAAHYLIEAGANAKEMNANTTALELFIRAEKVLKRMRKPDSMFRTLLNIGEVMLNIGKRDEAEGYFDRALKWAKKLGEIPKAKTYNLIGEIYSARGEINQAMEYTEKAMKIFRTEGHKEGLSAVLNNAGELQFKLSKFSDALQYFQEALDISLKMKDAERSALIYYRMARIYDIKGNFNKALHFYENALEIYEDLNNKEGLSYVYSNLGGVYINQGKYNKAEEYLKNAINKAKEMDNLQIVELCELNLGVVEFYKGNLDKALRHYENALKISEKIADKEMELQSLANIAEIWEKKGAIKKAMKYYEAAKDGAKDVGNKYVYIYALLKIGTLYYQLAEYEKSISILNASIQEALKLNLKDLYYKSLLTLSRGYIQIGFQDKVMAIFHKIPEEISIPEIEAEVLALKGKYYLSMRKTKEIEDIIKRLKKLNEPGNNLEITLKYYTLNINYLLLKNDIEKLGAFIQEAEKVINQMSFWGEEEKSILLSMAHYFLSVNDYTTAYSLAKIIKDNSKEREIKEDLIDTLILEGEIYSDMKKERKALKSFEEAALLTLEIYNNLGPAYRERFFNIRKRIFPIKSTFTLYLKRENIPLLLKFLSNIPTDIRNILFNLGNRLNPGLIAQVKKYLQ